MSTVLRGHTVAITTPHNLTVRDSITSAFCNVIKNQELRKNMRNTILINKNWTFSETELNALIHHELGVHLITRYLSGNLTLARLKILALRVIAVDMMVNKNTFLHTFHTLMDFFGILNELISRQIVTSPKYMPVSFSMKRKEHPILDYLISSIR